MIKIFKGFDDKLKKKFQSVKHRAQGYDFKLYKPQVNLDVRKYFFSRVIDME